MKAHAAALPAENQNYRSVLKFQDARIAELGQQIKHLKEEVEALRKGLQGQGGAADAQMDALRAATVKARQDLAEVRQQAVQERVRLETEREKLLREVEMCQKQMTAMAEKHADQVTALHAALKAQGVVPKPAARPAAALRTWTDVTGRYRIEAALVKLENGKVLLRKRDGSMIALPLEKLSREDREYVGRRGDGP
jgi:hypothetical protein